ncbi:MAG TPA: hypothetical protein VI874_00070 [Candidatus Norongarragalinales archaeon]|nr:hypothetical protein [Candidatus Norongarragalinales archaeon]
MGRISDEFGPFDDKKKRDLEEDDGSDGDGPDAEDDGDGGGDDGGDDGDE